MAFETLRDALPPYANDIRLNLSALAADPVLTSEQRAGAFIAAAFAARNTRLTGAVLAAFAPALSPIALEAAKTAAAMMAMTNVYFRFTSSVEHQDYAAMASRLRMNALGKPGVPRADLEIWAIAASALNGSGLCMDSHEKIARQSGVSAEAVQCAVRIAATINAAATVMDGEAAIAAAQEELPLAAE